MIERETENNIMCITFLFTGDFVQKYKLILINNRDEFYSRSTQNATNHASADGVQSIFGVDLAGAMNGTWLGLSVKNEIIKVGNLANVTGEEIKGKRGRGPIVTNFIKNDDSIEQYNEKLSKISHDFSSFNFLSVEMNSDEIKTFYISNAPKSSQLLPLGFIGMGNSPLFMPFKKVEAGTEQFRNLLSCHKDSTKDELIEALMELLKSTTKHFPDAELSTRRNETAEAFSSIYVDLREEGYGTRTRTVILIDNKNNVDYIEETMKTENPNGEWEKTHLNIPHETIITKL